MSDQPYDQMSDTDPERPLYPDALVTLSGEDGNAFAMIARTRTALRRAGASNEEITRFQEEAQSGDYDNVILTIMRWAHVR